MFGDMKDDEVWVVKGTGNGYKVYKTTKRAEAINNITAWAIVIGGIILILKLGGIALL